MLPLPLASERRTSPQTCGLRTADTDMVGESMSAVNACRAELADAGHRAAADTALGRKTASRDGAEASGLAFPAR